MKSFGHSYALPKFLTKPEELAPILTKLVEKLGFRMRREGFQAKGVHLGLLFRDHEFWHQGLRLDQPLFLSQDIYRVAYRLLSHSPYHLPVRNLAVSCFDLSGRDCLQLGLFEDKIKKDLEKMREAYKKASKELDDIQERQAKIAEKIYAAKKNNSAKNNKILWV